MKKLIFILIVSLTILVSTTAFAESSNGIGLIDWYNQTFSKESKNVNDEFGKKVELLNSEIDNLVSTGIESLIKDTELYSGNLTSKTREEIENYQKSYIERLEETKNQLLHHNFQQEEQQLKERIKREIDQDILDILDEVLN